MSPGSATYREGPAPPVLAPWVACAWEVEAGPDGRLQRVLPDGCMDIVFVDGRGLEAVGANPAAFLSAIPPGGRAVGVRMRPGGAPPLLGVTGEALLDARPPAAEVLGDDARRLEEQVAGAATGVKRTRAILGWLADRARRAERPDPVGDRVARRLAGDPRAAVTDLADEAGIGARHLRRRVVREVGYGPRRLARVLRLQRTVALAAEEPDADLSELAFRAGYADQAHLSHECRDLAGVPPSRLLGLERTFIDPSGTFGQLATGDTALAFAHESLAVGNFAGGVQLPDGAAAPFNVELAMVFDDPVAAFAHAVDAGCASLSPPEEQSHGQVVGWVRDPWGTLIEVCSPIG